MLYSKQLRVQHMIGSTIGQLDLIMHLHIGGGDGRPVVSYLFHEEIYKNEPEKKDYFVGLCISVDDKIYFYFRRADDKKTFFKMIFEKTENYRYKLIEYFNIAVDELQDPSWKILGLKDDLNWLIKQFEFFLSRHHSRGKYIDSFASNRIFPYFSDVIDFSKFKK